MSTRIVRLLELDGEVTHVVTSKGTPAEARHPVVMFTCPVCKDHVQMVPYDPGGKGWDRRGPGAAWPPLAWANPSGSTIEDITLSPSFLSHGPPCRVHVFIRSGNVEILGDTGLVSNR